MTGRDSELFQVLVFQLAQSGWAALGKVPEPVSGKVQRNLELARMTIDMLSALETRTKGNLSADESATLERALRELRMNYLDEQKKDSSSGAAGEA